MELHGRLSKIHERAKRRRDVRPAAAQLEERLPKARSVGQSSERGVTVRTTFYPLSALHGDLPLGSILEVDPAVLGRAARLDGALDPREALFFDTETTGLGGGAGVYVFLVGLLTVERSAIRVDQILLADLGAEEPYLDRVAAAMERRGKLISFFGKSFDRHRLDDRFALNLRGRPCGKLPHCDLYYLARGLFGEGLRDGRLRTLEESLLGVRRLDDLDGSECPAAYFEFLDGAADDLMERILKHNLIDVLSLLTLTVRVDRGLRRPEGACEAAGAGLTLLKAGDGEQALKHFETAVGGIDANAGRIGRGVRRSALELVRLYRRSGHSPQALDLLERLARALPEDPEPLFLAAKIAEHDLKDVPWALALAIRLRSRLQSRPAGRNHAALLADTHQRIARLER